MKSGPFEVTVVRVTGAPFNEHSVVAEKAELPDSTKISCFLESEEDCTFSLRIKSIKPVPHHDWVVKLDIDGRRVEEIAFASTSLPISCSHLVSEENGRRMQGKLTFAALATTDKVADVTVTSACLNSLGRIEASFWRGQCTKTCPGMGQPVVKATVGTVLEAAKKLSGSVTSTQLTEYYNPLTSCEFEYMDEECYHRFSFNYRTTPVLQLMNIVDGPKVVQDPPEAVVSKKRKAEEIIYINSSSDDDDDDETEAGLRSGSVAEKKRSKTALLKKRVKFLEEERRKLEAAVRRGRIRVPIDQIDLTIEDDD